MKETAQKQRNKEIRNEGGKVDVVMGCHRNRPFLYSLECDPNNPRLASPASKEDITDITLRVTPRQPRDSFTGGTRPLSPLGRGRENVFSFFLFSRRHRVVSGRRNLSAGSRRDFAAALSVLVQPGEGRSGLSSSRALPSVGRRPCASSRAASRGGVRRQGLATRAKVSQEGDTQTARQGRTLAGVSAWCMRCLSDESCWHDGNKETYTCGTRERAQRLYNGSRRGADAFGFRVLHCRRFSLWEAKGERGKAPP